MNRTDTASAPTALVIGAATTGTGIARLLCHRGYDVTLTDSKDIPDAEALEAMGIHCFPGGHPEELKREYDLILKNPGIPYSVPFVDYFVQKGVFIYNDLEIALRFLPNVQAGAITGTNGKTTTTTLLGQILHAADEKSFTAGNIGISMGDMTDAFLQKWGPEAKAAIALEVGAFQLMGFQDFHPHAATITNLTPDHLDYFGTLDAYYRSKTRIYRNMTKEDFFFLNIEDPLVLTYCTDIPATTVTFSTQRTRPGEMHADLFVLEGPEDLEIRWGETLLFTGSDLHLPGNHNLQNAMQAAGLAYALGTPAALIRQTIQAFQGVEHRIEFVADIGGVSYYNDSKGTNTDATIVALKAFDRPIHLLAGGYDKGLPFDALAPHMTHVKQMYVYGATREKLKALWPSARVFDTMREALDAASSEAKAGEVVLLSPCCASWDQFPNFEERGRQFKEQVLSMKAQKEANQ